jgi:hypothetical protein
VGAHPDAKDVLHGLAWLWDIIKVDPLRLGKHYICYSFELLALILIDLYALIVTILLNLH